MSRLTRRREPFRFMVWLGIVGSVLLFTVLLGIYIVRQAGPDWHDVALPGVFVISTLVILLSSLTLYNANRAFRHEQFSGYRINMATTLALGVMFMVLQAWGWRQMFRAGVGLEANPAGGFVYLLSGLHLLHILVGLVLIVIALAEAMRRRAYVEAFVYSVNPPNQLKIKLLTLYWHFVDVLWLVLFVFLLFHHCIDWRL